MVKPIPQPTIQHPSAIILGIYAPYNRSIDMDSYFEEFENLIRSDGIEYEESIFIKLREIDSAYFLTSGKLTDLKEACERLKVEYLYISEPLTIKQERNLEDFLKCTVIDRTRLILEIFEKGATTSEGKIQVMIAKLHHEKARLTGKGIHLAQQKGGIGIRGGMGETLKERQKRLIEEKINHLKKQLETYKKHREVQRKQRLNRGIPHICLIGYTNAGKSTILNALTKSDVFAADKLFATLDTTTRELYINSIKKGVISDTVGFIQRLPHHLIEAFKSTLSELQYADLLLHVVDVSDPNWQEHIAVVHSILEELNVKKEMLYVFNKSDRVAEDIDLESRVYRYSPYVITCAKSKEGLADLIDYLDTWQPTRESISKKTD